MANTFLSSEMIKQTIGKQSDPIKLYIEKGAIIKFAQAIGDTNPLWNDEAVARLGPNKGIVAPPTFLRSLGQVRAAFPFDMPFDRALDGGSEWEYFEHVRPGDTITAIATIIGINEREGRLGTMIITTTKTEYSNQLSQVVVTQTNTSIRY
jgi:acyl dehydratase